MMGLGAADFSHTPAGILLKQNSDAANAVAMQPWRKALANRDLAAANYMIIGDSSWEGYGATQMNRSAARRISPLLNKKRPLTMQTGTTYTAPTQPIGGRGFIPSFHSGTLTQSDKTEGVVTTGGGFGVTAGFGVNLNYWTASAAGNQLYNLVGDNVEISIYAGPGLGVLSYQIDGGAAIQINTAVVGNSYAYLTAPIALGAAGAHTLQINWVSGAIFVNGVVEYNGDLNAGIVGHHAGFVGTSALSYAQNGGLGNAATATFEHAINANCALVGFMLGINDANSGGRKPAQYQSDLIALYAYIRSLYNIFAVPVPTMAHFIQYTPSTTTADPSDGWPAYVNAAYQAAASDTNAVVVDISKRLPSAAVNGAGTYFFDGAHPNDNGYAAIADIISDFLATTW